MRAALLTLGRGHGRPGTLLTPKGIVIHSTASADHTPRPDLTAQQIRQYFEGGAGGRKASAHVVLDWKESLVLIPCWPGAAERAWHAGATANARFIGVEWAEEDDPAKFIASYRRLTKIVYLLCQVWEWAPEAANIWSHKQVSETWRESTHTDPYPHLSAHGYTWEQLLVDIGKGGAA